jgi:hypothetical protein
LVEAHIDHSAEPLAVLLEEVRQRSVSTAPQLCYQIVAV